MPEAPLKRWLEQRRALGSGMAGELTSDRDLLPGVTIATDLGAWEVIETPGARMSTQGPLFEKEAK